MTKDTKTNELWFGTFHDIDEGVKEFELFKTFKNRLSKIDVFNHIKKLKYGICGNESIIYDLFTKKRICIDGYYCDGNFMIAREFLHYLKNYDIGIPYEYEEYLINECGLKPKEN